MAAAASEQSGRTRVPQVLEVRPLAAWLATLGDDDGTRRCVLSLEGGACRLDALPRGAAMLFLSGPEGGLSASEEDAAKRSGFQPVSLGPRVLRADTAPLAALAAWAALSG